MNPGCSVPLTALGLCRFLLSSSPGTRGLSTFTFIAQRKYIKDKRHVICAIHVSQCTVSGRIVQQSGDIKSGTGVPYCCYCLCKMIDSRAGYSGQKEEAG